MGSATQRKLVALGPHDRSTIRALPVDRDMEASRAPGQPAMTVRELLALKFFAEGEAQESAGAYHETAHIPIRSLDRVPRSGRAVLIISVLALASTAAGYFSAWRIWSWLFSG
jgi:hypothetical protein